MTIKSVRIDADVAANINNILVSEMGYDSLSLDTNEFLRNIGIDSLDRVELIIRLEQRYNISLLDEEIANCETISDIETLVKSKITI